MPDLQILGKFFKLLGKISSRMYEFGVCVCVAELLVLIFVKARAHLILN